MGQVFSRTRRQYTCTRCGFPHFEDPITLSHQACRLYDPVYGQHFCGKLLWDAQENDLGWWVGNEWQTAQDVVSSITTEHAYIDAAYAQWSSDQHEYHMLLTYIPRFVRNILCVAWPKISQILEDLQHIVPLQSCDGSCPSLERRLTRVGPRPWYVALYDLLWMRTPELQTTTDDHALRAEMDEVLLDELTERAEYAAREASPSAVVPMEDPSAPVCCHSVLRATIESILECYLQCKAEEREYPDDGAWLVDFVNNILLSREPVMTRRMRVGSVTGDLRASTVFPQFVGRLGYMTE